MVLHRAIKEERSIFLKVTVAVIKVKVKITLEQATKAQGRSRGIALLFL
jgi:hypothetical protein